MYRAVSRWFLWDHQSAISSEEDLRAYHKQVSLVVNLGGFGRGIGLALLVSTLLYLAGVGFSVLSNQTEEFLANPLPAAFALGVFLSIALLLVGDRKIVEVIVVCRPAFEVDDGEYYGFFGRMIERMYEHLPYAPRPESQLIHRPTSLLLVASVVVGVIIPLSLAPEMMGSLFNFDWTSLSPFLQLYSSGLLILSIVLGVIFVWPVIVTIPYLGFYIQSLPIHLDVTRKRDRLGLEPFARFMLEIHFGYLILLTVIGLILVSSESLLAQLGFVLATLLPVVGFPASQYGLHKAIVRSKERRLAQLRDAYGDEINHWFSQTPINSTAHAPPDDFLAVKQEIESLPEWPINLRSLSEITIGVLSSNLIVLGENFLDVFFQLS